MGTDIEVKICRTVAFSGIFMVLIVNITSYSVPALLFLAGYLSILQEAGFLLAVAGAFMASEYKPAYSKPINIVFGILGIYCIFCIGYWGFYAPDEGGAILALGVFPPNENQIQEFAANLASAEKANKISHYYRVCSASIAVIGLGMLVFGTQKQARLSWEDAQNLGKKLRDKLKGKSINKGMKRKYGSRPGKRTGILGKILEWEIDLNIGFWDVVILVLGFVAFFVEQSNYRLVSFSMWDDWLSFFVPVLWAFAKSTQMVSISECFGKRKPVMDLATGVLAGLLFLFENKFYDISRLGMVFNSYATIMGKILAVLEEAPGILLYYLTILIGFYCVWGIGLWLLKKAIQEVVAKTKSEQKE
jgi:hypothetical protein